MNFNQTSKKRKFSFPHCILNTNFSTKAAAVIFTSILFASCVSTPNNSQSKTENNIKKVPVINNPLPAGRYYTLEDFETNQYFYINAASNAAWIDFSQDWCSEGENCIQLHFSKRKKSSTSSAIICNNQSNFEIWKDGKILLTDIYNSTRHPVEVFMEIQFNFSDNQYSTDPVLLGEGENSNIYFELQKMMNCSDGTKVYIGNDLDCIKSVSLSFTSPVPNGDIFIDNLRLVK